MVTVQEATDLISQFLFDTAIVEVDFEKSVGYMLAEDICADRDFPPFNRVMMDGIAINFDSWKSGIKSFPIAGIQTAGMAPLTLDDKAKCLEVMTGAMLPQHTDTVIRYEDIEVVDGIATITMEDVVKAQHVHSQGSDRLEGSTIIPAGRFIRPAEIAILATVGKSKVKVKKLPSVAIISTGDELVDVEVWPELHQIRRSNNYALFTELKKMHIEAEMFHLNDDKEELLEALKKIGERFDVILLSGGVSKGKKDYVPWALDEMGVEKVFHRVKQRPGKPFWFGRNSKNFVFAFPGNPVSTFMCYHKFFLPWLNKSLGHQQKLEYARLKEDFEFMPDLVYFLQVVLDSDEEGVSYATPVPGHGSGDLANLTDAEAFMELPTGKNLFYKNEVYPIIRY